MLKQFLDSAAAVGREGEMAQRALPMGWSGRVRLDQSVASRDIRTGRPERERLIVPPQFGAGL